MYSDFRILTWHPIFTDIRSQASCFSSEVELYPGAQRSNTSLHSQAPNQNTLPSPTHQRKLFGFTSFSGNYLSLSHIPYQLLFSVTIRARSTYRKTRNSTPELNILTFIFISSDKPLLKATSKFNIVLLMRWLLTFLPSLFLELNFNIFAIYLMLFSHVVIEGEC